MNRWITPPILSLILFLGACDQSITTSEDVEMNSSSSQSVVAGLPADEELLDQIQNQISSSSNVSVSTSSSSLFAMPITQIKLLSSLNTIQIPAFSDDGIQLLQFDNTGNLGVLSIHWDGSTQWIHSEAGLQYAFLTGQGTHQASILNLGNSWPFYIDGVASSQNGSSYYKEYLTSNPNGLFWVDYGMVSTGGGSSGGSGGRQISSSTDLQGRLLFKAWGSSTIDTLLTSSHYKSRLEASSTHLTWVEFAPNSTQGVVQWMDLSTKQIRMASESTHHQDRPSIDGDYLVWEEYLDASNAVIRTMQLSTGTVKDLSSRSGFRTNPDVHQGRAVWEDQRTGNGDIWGYDLLNGTAEQPLIQGDGHSAGVRLYQDKVIWIESNDNAMGLVMGTW